MRVVKNDYIVR